MELDLSSAGGNSLGCDVTVTVNILDGVNAGTYIVVYLLLKAIDINRFFPTTHKFYVASYS